MWADTLPVHQSLVRSWEQCGHELNSRLAPAVGKIDQLFASLEQLACPQVGAEAGLEQELARLAWQATQNPICELWSRGGKRLRSLLCHYHSMAEGGEAGSLCVMVELVHTSSLIADDIEDGSPLRRGKPVVHQVCGLAPALNSSCWGYFMAPLLIEMQDLTAEQTLELHRCYQRCLRRLHLGQALDIHWHHPASNWPESQDYLAMCRLKTGALLGLAAESALIPLAVPSPRVRQLADLWQDVGQAFQMVDDLQNLSCGIEGKMVADDLLEGKKSWPLLCALERLQGHTRADYQRWLEQCMAAAQRDKADPGPREQVQKSLAASGVLAACYHKAEQLLQECWQRLGAFYSRPQTECTGLFDLLLLCYRGLVRCR